MRFIKNFLRDLAIFILVLVAGAVFVALTAPDSSGLIALMVFLAPPFAVWANRKFKFIVGASIASEDKPEPKVTQHTATRPRQRRVATSPKPAAKSQEPNRQFSEAFETRHIGSVAKAQASENTKGWILLGQSAQVKGRELGGLIYVGSAPWIQGTYTRQRSRAYIDPSLGVASVDRDPGGRGMGYWPSYRDISPASRATYLDWLAAGRVDSSVNPGYMFLYFYGLEYRFFQDKSPLAEQHQIREEVARLKDLFHHNGSAQRYLGDFLDASEVLLSEQNSLIPKPNHRLYDVPLSVKIAAGTALSRGETLSGELLLSWFVSSPDARLRTPATRCFDEFCALFLKLFDRSYPKGLNQKAPAKILSYEYHAASNDFVKEITISVDGQPVPDISHLRRSITVAQKIADEAMEALDKYSRFLGKNPEAKATVEAHALLPQELWEEFPNKELEEIKNWIVDRIAEGGLVSADQLVSKMLGDKPHNITKRVLTDTADALARMGVGMAPDPRFALRSVKADEPLVLFDLGEKVQELATVSDAYRAALIELTVGSFIIHADGQVVNAETEFLKAKVQSANHLTGQEQARLAANLTWLLAVPPETNLIRKAAKSSSEEAKALLRSILVDAARADGHVHLKEVQKIEAVYKLLGLDAALAYSDLHSGVAAPMTVRTAIAAAPGEAIPPEAEERPSPQALDMNKIASIRQDTQRVSNVLSEIFSEEEIETTDKRKIISALPGLSATYVPLVQALIEQDTWTEQDFESLCKSHKAIPSATLEDLNEWAFEAFDDALLDAYGDIDLIPETAEAIQQTLETALS